MADVQQQNPLLGPIYLLRGYAMLPRKGLKRWVIAPLLLNLVLIIVFFSLAITGFNQWLDGLLPEGWVWLQWLIWPLFVVLTLVLSAFTFTILINLIAAPFNTRLAAAVARMHGVEPVEEETSFWASIPEAIKGELGKLLYLLRWILPLLLLGFIPLLQLTTPLAWGLFAAWMLAIEYSDYPLGNMAVKPKEQRAWLARAKGRSLGFGSAVMGATVVPFINLAVVPAAVIGATLMWLDAEGHSKAPDTPS
jgi:CysZ protein